MDVRRVIRRVVSGGSDTGQTSIAVMGVMEEVVLGRRWDAEPVVQRRGVEALVQILQILQRVGLVVVELVVVVHAVVEAVVGVVGHGSRGRRSRSCRRVDRWGIGRRGGGDSCRSR